MLALALESPVLVLELALELALELESLESLELELELALELESLESLELELELALELSLESLSLSLPLSLESLELPLSLSLESLELSLELSPEALVLSLESLSLLPLPLPLALPLLPSSGFTRFRVFLASSTPARPAAWIGCHTGPVSCSSLRDENACIAAARRPFGIPAIDGIAGIPVIDGIAGRPGRRGSTCAGAAPLSPPHSVRIAIAIRAASAPTSSVVFLRFDGGAPASSSPARFHAQSTTSLSCNTPVPNSSRST